MWGGTRWNIAGLIPQSIQLRSQVTLARLGWYQKLEDCANSCARRSVCFYNWTGAARQYSSAYALRSGDWGRRAVRFARLALNVFKENWRGLCGCNTAIEYGCCWLSLLRRVAQYISQRYGKVKCGCDPNASRHKTKEKCGGKYQHPGRSYASLTSTVETTWRTSYLIWTWLWKESSSSPFLPPDLCFPPRRYLWQIWGNVSVHILILIILNLYF